MNRLWQKVARHDNPGLWGRIKPRKIHFRHYFGAATFILILVQLLTGLYMIFFYEPTLRDAYLRVQYFNNQAFLGAFTRNVHRYAAFLIGATAFLHLATGYFRRDYTGGRKLYWFTGVIMILVLGGYFFSGSILPWEWKGYWLMEMFNNWFKNIPVFGNGMYLFFMDTYTPTRNFVIHDIILPIITFILLEIHCLARIKKRGFTDYLVRQTFAVMPLLIAVVAMSVLYPIPTQDPDIIPLPMDGQYIPAPEWWVIIFYLPYWYFPSNKWPIYLFWIPVLLIVVLFILPLLFKRLKRAEEQGRARKIKISAWLYTGAGSLLGAFMLAVFLWGGVRQPWMGCNSCHNSAMGDRMGLPPVTFKDTTKNPVLLDNRWMIRHWYEPQVVW